MSIKNNIAHVTSLSNDTIEVIADFKVESRNVSTQISASIGQQNSEALESFADHHSLAEVSLLRAVILQAIVDTMSNSKRTEEKVAKHDAIDWFDLTNKDFKLICELSGWSADWVLNATKKAVQNPEKWRRNHGRYNNATEETTLN